MNNNNYFENLFKYWDKSGDISKKKLEKQEENLEKETGKWSTHFKSLVVPKIKLLKSQMYFNINNGLFDKFSTKREFTLSVSWRQK